MWMEKVLQPLNEKAASIIAISDYSVLAVVQRNY
jgi:hypothetical protein